MTFGVGLLLTVVLPMVALLRASLMGPGLAERHHSHHDTYSVSSFLLRSVVVAMLFMAVLGVIFGWLCEVDAFAADSDVVVAFFAAFELMAFFMWFCMVRYRVVTYGDHMSVTPFVGPRVDVPYDAIECIEWTSSSSLVGYQSVRVRSRGRRRVTLWGTIDVDQVLMRIDRYDVLESRVHE